MNASQRGNSHRNHLLLMSLTGIVILLGTGIAVSQSNAPYQVGSILAVKDHQSTAQEDSMRRYDISVKVGNTVYVVLYSASDGNDVAQYKVGLDFPVQIDGKTMRFSDALGRPMSVPIINQKPFVAGKTNP